MSEAPDTAQKKPSYEELKGTVEELRRRNAHLEEELAQLKRMIFGAKSERFVPAEGDEKQGLLFGEHPDRKEEGEKEAVSYERKKGEKKEKPVRKKLPGHLRREEEVVEPEGLPEGAERIGEEETELLEYVPGELYVRRIVRPRYAMGEDGGVKVAELPSLPLPKSLFGPGTLAHINVSKFIDHLPLYRQERIFKRQGVELAQSTLGDAVDATARLLAPLYEELKERVLAQSHLQADESPIRVMDGHKKGATATGYQWVYHAPELGAVFFDHRSSRARAGPEEVLKDYEGVLQTDGYRAYDKLQSERITLHACMAHARRKFDQAKESAPERARHGLSLFARLYEVERKARERGMDHSGRHELRQKEAAPVMEELHGWLIEQRDDPRLLPKSPLARAVHYTLGLWERLERYLEDGRYEIDNNLIENSIRPLALGRKNYLFAGSHKAAQNIAIMYSLLGTAKMNGLEPYQWLKDTLERIPEHKANKLHELLPLAKS
jgi:transposase